MCAVFVRSRQVAAGAHHVLPTDMGRCAGGRPSSPTASTAATSTTATAAMKAAPGAPSASLDAATPATPTTSLEAAAATIKILEATAGFRKAPSVIPAEFILVAKLPSGAVNRKMVGGALSNPLLVASWSGPIFDPVLYTLSRFRVLGCSAPAGVL